MGETSPRNPMDDVERLPQYYREQLGKRIRHAREGIESLYDVFGNILREGLSYEEWITEHPPSFGNLRREDISQQKLYAERVETIIDILSTYMRGGDVGATADSASVGKEYTVRLFMALGFGKEDAETIWNMGISEIPIIR